MNFRYQFSIILVVLGIISAIMSFGGNNKDLTAPEEILPRLLAGDYRLSPDELAGILADQDSGFQIIDTRVAEDYRAMSLPGAVHLPIEILLEASNESLFTLADLKTVFYSNDELAATQAWMLAMQKGYRNLYVLEGGLAAWDSLVMKSKFEGEKITARENILFEKRYKARRQVVQWNAMPDSLKAG